jgi:hypothetical protein
MCKAYRKTLNNLFILQYEKARLEHNLRNKIDEYWKEFYYHKYIGDVMNMYGDKDIESCEDVPKHRLFFDWFMHTQSRRHMKALVDTV